MFVFYNLRSKHFSAGMTAVILENLELVLFTAVLDDVFALAIGTAVQCLVDDRLLGFMASPEQVEMGTDCLELVGC